MASGFALPGRAHRILSDEGIWRKEREFMLDRLTDEHPVKGVPMKRWQLMQIQRGGNLQACPCFQNNADVTRSYPTGVDGMLYRKDRCSHDLRFWQVQLAGERGEKRS